MTLTAPHVPIAQSTNSARLSIPHLLALLLVFSTASGAGMPSAFGQGESQNDEKPLVDRLAQTVLFINAIKATDGKLSAGTAFTVKHNGRLYIVTAKHVVTGAQEVRILASRKDGSVS